MERSRVKRLLRLRSRDVRAEITDEIEVHMALRIEQLMRAGLDENAARAEAERRFGALETVYVAGEERERTVRMREWLDTVRQDIALTLRSFARYPGFSAAVVGTLALGIGAAVAIFTLVHSILLRPLPYAEPSNLFAVLDKVVESGDDNTMSPLELNELRRRTTSFTALGSVTHRTATLVDDAGPVEVPIQLVTASFFEVLGVAPLLGRNFTPAHEGPGPPAPIILSHGAWQSRFGGDRDVVGRSIFVNGYQREIIGVMPAGFHFGDAPTEFWMPLRYPPDFPGRFLWTIGRLKPGVTAERAETELKAAMAQLAQEEKELFGWGLTMELRPLRTHLVGDAQPVLVALTGAVLLLLLIACANVANLLLARALRRRTELAVRLSLGAARTRVVRQLLTESALLAVSGGVAGVLLATWAIRFALTRLPQSLALPRAAELEIDARIVVVALAVTALTTLLFGIAPALIAARAGDHAQLLRGARGSTGAAGLGRARAALVVAQVALVAVLLGAAGLLGRTYWQLQAVDMGMNTSDVIFGALPGAATNTPDPRVFHREVLQRVQAIPGVTVAGMVQHVPLTGERSTTKYGIEGSDQGLGSADIRIVHGSAFDALGVRPLQGRTFNADDREGTATVFVVNRALAQTLGGDVIARRIYYSWGGEVNGKIVPLDIAGEIIGVVEDIRESGPAVVAAPAIYRPYEQDPNWMMSLVLRANGSLNDVTRAVSEQVRELDRAQPVTITRVEDLAATHLARPRMQFMLIGTFAALALTLAAVGLYGVIAYAVDQRRKEIGVRLAVGATPTMVTALVVKQAVALTSAGLLLGAVVAAVALPALRRIVFGVQLADPLTIAATAFYILLVAVLAALLPAVRAARIDPVTALRAE
jgi:putative ABC transport system permease protein